MGSGFFDFVGPLPDIWAVVFKMSRECFEQFVEDVMVVNASC